MGEASFASSRPEAELEAGLGSSIDTLLPRCEYVRGRTLRLQDCFEYAFDLGDMAGQREARGNFTGAARELRIMRRIRECPRDGCPERFRRGRISIRQLA